MHLVVLGPMMTFTSTSSTYALVVTTSTLGSAWWQRNIVDAWWSDVGASAATLTNPPPKNRLNHGCKTILSGWFRICVFKVSRDWNHG